MGKQKKNSPKQANRITAKSVLLLVLGIGIAAVAYFVFRDDAKLEFRWPKGTEYVYALEYITHNETNVVIDMENNTPQKYEADASFACDWVLRSYGTNAKGHTLLGHMR